MFFLSFDLPVNAQETMRPAPAPLYRDPITDGAADPVLVWNRDSHSWWMLYTQRTANIDAPDVAYCYGTQIGAAESTDNGHTWVYRGTLDLDFEKGHNTFWAPDVVYSNGKYHLFIAYIRGVRSHWGGDKQIVHYTSKNLWDWKYEGALPLSSSSVIDATVFQKPDGKWRLWYKDEMAGSHTFMVESDNLYKWSAPQQVIGKGAHEGPKVFSYKGYFWMLTDEWQGLRVYRSKDLDNWEKQDLILAESSYRTDDGPTGAHADVVVTDNGAYVFYFTHPGRMSHTSGELDENGVLPYKLRRSSIQVGELIFKDGRLSCNHNTDFDYFLPDGE